jgi:hypothetical protein
MLSSLSLSLPLSIDFTITGVSDPRAVSSAIRLLMLIQNWLHSKRFRKSKENTKASHSLFRDKEREKMSLSSSVRQKREKSDDLLGLFTSRDNPGNPNTIL